jgi:UDP-N-acetylglucosamine--N-acetylmuramyl-(pentapeptide) pyrophosphoryl-undecaprenol N-acetylglucosamine transferase
MMIESVNFKGTTMEQQNRYIISGGGTGGHIFPAISIANALKERFPQAEILFVGALGRMEMERVPAAGYKITGLPVSGFDRKNMLRNIKVLWNLMRSLLLARRIIREFRPDIAIGVGGYASAPVLRAASAYGVPTVIQEQNSYAGVTNKLLARKAARICVAYDGMEKFFPAEKIVKTGNPVRQDLLRSDISKEEALAFFGFQPGPKTLLVLGGSLGARTINRSVIAQLKALAVSGVQVIWQTGKFYIEDAKKAFVPYSNTPIFVTDFLSRMDYAYAAADLVISRAGAGSISELCLLGKPVVLVPSPNVAEDHQTRNAMALVEHDAAVMIRDADAIEKLIPTALKLMMNADKLTELSKNIRILAEPNSAGRIVDEIVQVQQRK